jgi:hypothetical protein
MKKKILIANYWHHIRKLRNILLNGLTIAMKITLGNLKITCTCFIVYLV